MTDEERREFVRGWREKERQKAEGTLPPMTEARRLEVARAFCAFGAALARSRQIEMTVCPTCEQPHVLDVGREIWKAVERVRRVKSAGR